MLACPAQRYGAPLRKVYIANKIRDQIGIDVLGLEQPCACTGAGLAMPVYKLGACSPLWSLAAAAKELSPDQA